MKPWKLQKFFGDVVYDLRNRGLLPVVILLLVAMVAVPVLISRGGSEAPSSSLQPASGLAQPAPEAQNAVVSYAPGVRDYKKRLNGLSPKDPFRQQFAQSAAAASQLESTVTTPTTTGSTATTGSTGSGSPSLGTTIPGSSGKKKSKKKKKSSKTTYTYSVTVMAGDASNPLTPFGNVASLTPLPGQATPVVVYYGLSSDYTQALFLVSNKVDSMNGPGTCLPAPDDCSLLALSPGQSADLHYTQDDKSYRILVAEIKRVAR
jgi:hypothetical protein